jgi:hypothetical protein
MPHHSVILRRLLVSGYFSVLVTYVVFAPATALADGGALRCSERVGDLRVSVFSSPAVLRVGMIDVSVLVQDADTQEICDDVPVSVRLESVDGVAIPLQETATSAAATNRLFKTALFEVSTAGTWRATVSLSDASSATPISLDLEIVPPPPPWLQLAPWIGWPFAVVAMFLVHQRLAARKPMNLSRSAVTMK